MLLIPKTSVIVREINLAFDGPGLKIGFRVVSDDEIQSSSSNFSDSRI